MFPGVLALAAAVCLAGSVNDLLTKMTANVYTQTYAFFVDQAANVLYSLFAAIPVVWAIAFERTGSLKSRLPDGLLRCPQQRFAFMGLLDALGTFLSSIGGPGTPGHLQVVLNQTLVLFTMVAAFAWLGTRHDAREVACACLIFCGAMISASGSAGDDGTRGTQVWSVVMFTMSNIPMALSNVYKELGFADKSLRLDVWSMTCITTCYQTLATFLLLPLQTVPYLSGDERRGLSLTECWVSLLGGGACFFGRSESGIECSTAGPLLTGYVLANLGLNCLSLCLTKLGAKNGVGSVLCSLAYALKLPFSNLLFAQRWLMGPHVEKLSLRSLVGLVVVVGGFLGYMYYSGPGKGDADERRRAAEHAEQSIPCQEQELATDLPSEDSEGAATLYVQFPRDDVDEEPDGSEQPWTLVDSTWTVPEDAEPWAFHDRLVGCDSSNSARLVSSRQLKRGLAELMCGGAEAGPSMDEL